VELLSERRKSQRRRAKNCEWALLKFVSSSNPSTLVLTNENPEYRGELQEDMEQQVTALAIIQEVTSI